MINHIDVPLLLGWATRLIAYSLFGLNMYHSLRAQTKEDRRYFLLQMSIAFAAICALD